MSNSTKDTIRSLSTREQCRTKLPVWFGSRENHFHAVLETLANATDEITNNYDDGEIEVWLSNDCKKISIFDTGRGIPINGETNGKQNYELLFCTLFSGTNYDNLENGKVTTGTNGCGITVLNHCSTLFEVSSYKNFKETIIRFEDGGGLVHPPLTTKSSVEHGTKVVFSLDEEVFVNTTFDYIELQNILKRLASTNNKLTIALKHQDDILKYHYESKKDYMEENSINKLSPTIMFAQKLFETGDEINTVGVSFSLSTEPLQQTFLNYTYLKEQGTLHEGFVDGMRKVFNKGVKKNKLTPQDIEMSFNFYVEVLSTNVEYANQTKFSTKKLLYKNIVSNYIVENLEVLKNEQPKLFEQMQKHLTTINGFNTKNEASRKQVTKVLEERATNATTRPQKLVPCRSRDPKEVELILIEGDSALNSVKLGRDAKTMMVYPLKGKPMNPLKKSIDAILQNQEIVDIFKILGCGITYRGKNVRGFAPFNIDNLMVNRVLVATDFDEDGFHIQSLLIGIFYILAPQLLLDEKIEFVKTPLYIIKQKDNEYYAYNEQERVDIVSKLVGTYKETRFKGLGGLPTSTMSKALKHETRESIVVTMEQAKICADKIELFLSDDIESRKKYIEENGSKYVTESMLV